MTPSAVLKIAARVYGNLPQLTRRRIFVITVCGLICSCFLLIIYIATDFRRRSLFSSIRDLNGEQKASASWHEVATRLAAVTRELKTSYVHGIPPSNKALHDLKQIMEALDPVLFADDPSEVDISVNQTTSSTASLNGYNSATQAAQSNRSRPYPDVIPFRNLISIIVYPSSHLKEDCSQHLSWTLQGIKDYLPSVTVYVAKLQNCSPVTVVDNPNVHFVEVLESASAGTVWAKLISWVSTPYLFLGRDVFHFLNYSLVQRLVNVMESDERIQSAAGAYRNKTGHWHVGCFQTELRNYVLEYTNGYYASKNDCMICDHFSGPFIARTSIFHLIPLDISLPKEMVFHDFFIRLKNSHYLAIVCPDAMNFANGDSDDLTVKEIWLPLTRKWELNRVLLPKDVLHLFSCEESGVSCKFMDSTSRSYLLPPCCLSQYTRALSWMRNTGIPFEIDSGSVLGAVKLQGSIPWDIDGDTIYLSANHSAWRAMKNKMAESGFELVEHNAPHIRSSHFKAFGGLFVVWTPDTTIEMYAEIALSRGLLPKEIRHLPTLAEIDGEWISAPASPGLYARNRYGREMLKHSQSYKHHKRDSSFSIYAPGKFLPCQRVDHHACLDRFPTDGNIAFKTP